MISFYLNIKHKNKERIFLTIVNLLEKDKKDKNKRKNKSKR